MTKEQLLSAIRGKIIVSCQALPGEPLYLSDGSIMYLMARAAKQAGAAAIRAQGALDVRAIKLETNLPVIGLIKRHLPDTDVIITPTLSDVDALVEANADVVALDCTLRPRPDGEDVNSFLARVRDKYPSLLLLADVSTLEEGVNACRQGVDFVATTLSSYTPYSCQAESPNFDLVRRLSQAVDAPIIAEGGVHEPSQAAELLRCGASAVVVGGAITRPLEIAARFVEAAKGVAL